MDQGPDFVWWLVIVGVPIVGLVLMVFAIRHGIRRGQRWGQRLRERRLNK